MALIKGTQVVSGDSWQSVPDGQPVPETGDVVVGLARFANDAAALAAHKGKLGVRVDPEDDLAALVAVLPKVALVAINFPKFGDGRGYSKARLLRERHAYKGELRAVGEVLGDQLFYMHRCGFDAYELVEGKDLDAALRCLADFSVTYQAATDDPRPLYRRVNRGA
ncbi:MAG: DUF934 domain-containing protein [Myxococcales bacterium]